MYLIFVLRLILCMLRVVFHRSFFSALPMPCPEFPSKKTVPADFVLPWIRVFLWPCPGFQGKGSYTPICPD
jgi:hypothetical protein